MVLAKDNYTFVRLTIPAQKAAPAPVIGPMLGQKGVNISQFCKKFNDLTQSYEPETPINTVVYIKPNKSFDIVLKGVPTVWLICKHSKSKTVSWSDLLQIAQTKLDYFNTTSLANAAKMVAGTAKSMGIQIVNV